VTTISAQHATEPRMQAGESIEAVGIGLVGVSKQFEAQSRDTFAVRDVNVQIEPGEFVTLLGPSGCGKSTTLHLIAGLEKPTDGQVLIGGRDVTFLDPQQRDVALVFQSYALYPHLDVYDNIAFPLRLKKRGLNDAEIAARVKAAAASLHLADLLERKPGELSGGQRQRTALARAIVRSPSVFLFDEPLSNLDNLLRVRTRAELKELHEKLHATMIYVTHDQAEAMVMSDRIAVMNDGRIQQIGAPLELYRRPINTFVATFIGEHGTNLVRGGSVHSGERGTSFRTRDISVQIPAEPAKECVSYTLGVRPENLQVCDPEQGEVAGTIRIVEPYGDRTRVRVQIGGEEVIASAPAMYMADPGTVVGLSIAERDALNLFDDATGDAVAMTAAHQLR
jgi:ABC-type sugar transport system ATPase subunit